MPGLNDVLTPKERAKFEDELLVDMPDLIRSNTEDNYLYGCIGEDSSTVDACVPSCLTGYKFSGMPSCKMRVYSRDKYGKLIPQNKIKTNRAYIYLEQGDKISSKDRRSLYNLGGIREMYIYKRVENSRSYEHVETVNLTGRKKRSSQQPKEITLANILALVVLLIIVLIVLYLIWLNLPR